MKRCNRCGETKDRLSEFHRTGSWCKECKREYAAEWRRNNREKYLEGARFSKLKQNYGISREEYEAMYEAQNGKCAICCVKSSETLQVDHDHITGKIRGLLCADCNRGLGCFKDSVLFLHRAARYMVFPALDRQLHEFSEAIEEHSHVA